MSPEAQEFILAAIAELKTDVKDGMSGVHARLDTLNGRTRTVERSVAVMWTFWGVIGAVALALLPDAVEAFWP
jgi:hypothetical protein